jgi:uncharacterized protein
MFDEFVAYVSANYSQARKIVEVGVGSRLDVAERIKKSLPLAEVLVTDKDSNSVRSHRVKQIKALADDVMYPLDQIYRDASLIYSIYPSVEIVPAMTELATKIGADLLIVPRSDEQEAFEQDSWKKIIRGGRTIAWTRTSARSPRMA